ERRRRLLKNEPDPPAADRAQRPLGKAYQLLAAEPDRRARLDAAGRRDQAEQRKRSQALAPARLANEPEDLAATDRDGGIAHDGDGGAVDRKGDPEVVDLDQAGHRRRRCPDAARLRSQSTVSATPCPVAPR